MSGAGFEKPISEADLHAYVDGQLGPSECARIEAFLKANPEKAREVADWERQNAALNTLFPRKEAERHAEKLGEGIQAATPPARGRVWQMAAALAIAAMGVGGGWYARGALVPEASAVVEAALVQEALSAHRVYATEVLHPVEVPASDAAHLVSWLSKRLGARIVAPDLRESGFTLVGGRLLPAGEGPAAQFMYEDTAGRRITLYATTGAPGVLASFQFETHDGLASVTWQDDTLRYAVIGPLAHDELSRLATEVYRQLI